MTARAKTGVDDPAALAPSTAVSYLLALFDYLRLAADRCDRTAAET